MPAPRRQTAPPKPEPCAYCFGLGLYADYFERGMRRPMERGTHGNPAHPRERVVPCDRCGKP